jgi:hypothetical protein
MTGYDDILARLKVPAGDNEGGSSGSSGRDDDGSSVHSASTVESKSKSYEALDCFA